jgi:hypothetical protein
MKVVLFTNNFLKEKILVFSIFYFLIISHLERNIA